MAFNFHLKNFFVFNQRKPAGGANSILSEKAFQRILERERARTDRYGEMFCLLIFDTAKSNGKRADHNTLSDILLKRLRPTDEVGWFKKSRLGVVLPSTPYEGALTLANDICKQILIREQSTLTFEIFSYPFDKSGQIDEKKQNDVLGESRRVIKGFPETQQHEDKAVNFNRLVEGSKSLFGQRLPWWKRGIDIIGSLLGLLLLFPLFLAIAICIKIGSPGPVFFRQTRIGYLGQAFTMFKFRSMRVNSDTALHENHITELIQNGKPMVKLDTQDPRITPLGKFLRVTGMDELPQLLNVLRGEMSLIGPRPELLSSLQYCEPWHSQRFDTHPGLSGLWQISGKTTTTFDEMMRLDINYVKKRSFWLDLVILMKTFPTIVSEARR